MPVRLRVEGVMPEAETASSLMRRYGARMLRALTLEHVELSLLVCDDRVMRRLNQKHRRIDRATDVLAFAMDEGHPIMSVQRLLGDIAISWPSARRQAREHGWSADRELCLLLAHGLLHLLGFDHATRLQERRMMARAHMLMAAALQPNRGGGQASRGRLSRASKKPRGHLRPPVKAELLR
jgi:probable rRNA maturation factor